MSKQEIIIMAVFSLIASSVIFYKIQVYESKEKQRDNQLFVGRSRKSSYVVLYNILINSSLTKAYVKRISLRYGMVYPDLNDLIAKKTVISVLGIWAADILLFVLIYLLDPTMINFISAVLIIYTTQIRIMSSLLKKTELKMLEQLDNQLSDIKHHYISEKNITTALWMSMESCRNEIRSHLEKIFFVLESSDIKKASIEYNEAGRNKYFKLLMGICIRTAEQGDSYVKGESVFTENINLLKRDIRREIEKIRRIQFIFSGLGFVSIAPVLAITPIMNWAVGNLSDLGRFYSGKIGFYAVVLAFIIAYVTFQMLERLRDTDDLYQSSYPLLGRICNLKAVKSIIDRHITNNYTKTQKMKELLKRLGEKYTLSVYGLRKAVFGTVGLIFGIILLATAYKIEQKSIFEDIYDIYDILPQRNKREISEVNLKEWILELRKQDSPAIIEKLRREGITDNKALEDIHYLLEKKFQKSNEAYVKWYEVLAVLLVSVLFYQYPYLMVMFKKQFLEDYMAEEVMCFQTIISMQVNLAGANLIEMLESMELFARVFKPSLQECINNMPINEKKALEDMKEKESYKPFLRIVDCFLMSDKTDIPTAFDEVVDDIRHFQDVYKLDMDIILERKSNVAQLIAFIPAYYILVFYLVLPFVTAGMVLFETSFQTNMNDAY